MKRAGFLSCCHYSSQNWKNGRFSYFAHLPIPAPALQVSGHSDFGLCPAKDEFISPHDDIDDWWLGLDFVVCFLFLFQEYVAAFRYDKQYLFRLCPIYKKWKYLEMYLCWVRMDLRISIYNCTLDWFQLLIHFVFSSSFSWVSMKRSQECWVFGSEPKMSPRLDCALTFKVA